MKAFLDFFRQFGEKTFEIPDFIFTTMPSGSTRVMVASLYSFPLTVLKSSEKAPDATEKIKTVRTFVFTYCLSLGSHFLFPYQGFFRQGELLGQRSVSPQPELPKPSSTDANSLELILQIALLCPPRRIRPAAN